MCTFVLCKHFTLFIMKKLLLVTIICLSALIVTPASAQGIYWGPKVGMNISSLTKTSNAKDRVRGEIGLMAGYQVAKVLALQVEALYSWQGTTIKDVKFNLNYLKIPVLAKVFIAGGLNVEAGVSFNILTSSVLDGNTYNGTNGFDFSIPVGVNYLIANLVEVGIRYDISLANVGLEHSSTAKNNNWALSVGIRF